MLFYCRPDLLELSAAQPLPDKRRVDLAVKTANKELGIPAIINAQDVCISNPDNKIIFMYVASLFIALPHDQHIDVSAPYSVKTSLTRLRLPIALGLCPGCLRGNIGAPTRGQLYYVSVDDCD
jgi:hypothetical protein